MLGLLLMLATFAGPIYVDPSGVQSADAHAAPTQLTYDAVEQRGRRKSPGIDSRSEDLILDSARRGKLQATAFDIGRNFSIAKWMIRRHLDYVASFGFHSRSGNDAFDEQVESKMGRWFAKDNCDRAGRHPFWRIVRLLELLRTTAGDVGVIKLADGRLQQIESDRIRNPSGLTFDGVRQEWVHGIKLDTAGKALAYAIHSRRPYGGFEYERTIPADNFILHGHFDRVDQVRGISPITSALNPLRDVYENFDYALAKAKVTQLFAMAFTRGASEDVAGADNVTATEETDENGNTSTRYEVDFGKGPVKLELEPGDDAKFLQSNEPNANFQDFTRLVIQVALKALDIPYSFFDESASTFYGGRAAWLHYERSCVFKRADLLDILNQITAWRLQLFILDGQLELPAGLEIDELAWEWVPSMTVPWWDPAKEINGHLAAIRAGIDSPQRITKEASGRDWYDNVDQIAKALDYARAKRVPLAFDPMIQPVEVVPADEVKQ
jgi:capsid protein